jgi:hypothetical protein
MQDGFPTTRGGVAKHIHEICLELREMAIQARLPFLATLLGMAAIQAAEVQRGDRDAGD